MNILGLSAYYHDSAVVLLQEGRIISALQEERFTRKKHDPAFPHQALQHTYPSCSPHELDYIAYYEKPLRKFERIVDTFLTVAPRGLTPFQQSLPTWATDKLFLPTTLKKQLRRSAKQFAKQQHQPPPQAITAPLVFPSHHESHAASAFFPSPFQEAAILTLDGVGEWSTITYGTGSGNQIQLQSEQRFPHSLGLLYSAFTSYCGFRVNSGEYKLMGLAPYGEPKYTQTIYDHLLTLHDDGSFHLNLSHFGYLDRLHMVNEAFEDLFGHPARQPDSGPLEQRHMDLAASIQQVSEDILLRLAQHLHRETGHQNLTLAGGCALNCVANGHLARKGPFKNIWIQPAAGDAGGALGAALFTQHQLLAKPRSHLQQAKRQDHMQSSLLGTSYSEQDIRQTLEKAQLPYSRPDELDASVAQLIAQENVLARFDGRMEYGPRALGNRSILGDPRSPKLQSLMNQKIKFREDFRPFAPVCLEEHAAQYFTPPHHSPYIW